MGAYGWWRGKARRSGAQTAVRAKNKSRSQPSHSASPTRKKNTPVRKDCRASAPAVREAAPTLR